MIDVLIDLLILKFHDYIPLGDFCVLYMPVYVLANVFLKVLLVASNNGHNIQIIDKLI